MRAIARAFTLGGAGSAVAVEGDAVQLHPMIDETEAEFLRNPLLKCLELFIDELDHIARLDVDQVVVVAFGRGFVAGTPVAELMPFENAGLFEQADSPIDRRDRNVGIDRRRPGVQSFDVRMVLAIPKDAGDDLALLGNPEALVGAQSLDVDRAGHGSKVGIGGSGVKIAIIASDKVGGAIQ